MGPRMRREAGNVDPAGGSRRKAPVSRLTARALSVNKTSKRRAGMSGGTIVAPGTSAKLIVEYGAPLAPCVDGKAVMSAQSPKVSREAALHQLRTAMIEKKLTQAELADAADCHEKTIQNLLNGRSVRDQTLFDVCMVLGLDFDKLKAAWAGAEAASPHELSATGGLAAPVYMGAYTEAAVDHYIGGYVTIRPAFSTRDMVVAYRTDITWDPEWPSLLFQERERPDAPYSHRGRLYIPASSMYIHLVSLTKGAMRMVMVSQLDQNKRMCGLITTLHKSGPTLVPVSAPVIYMKQDEIDPAMLGEIRPQHRAYAGYRKMLEAATADSYVKLVSP